MGGVPPSSGVEYDRHVDPVIEWCTALEWSAVLARYGPSSGSIFSGGLVLRLLPDCCGIGWIVIIVLCVCRSGRVLVGFVVLLCRYCFVIGLSVDLMCNISGGVG